MDTKLYTEIVQLPCLPVNNVFTVNTLFTVNAVFTVNDSFTVNVPFTVNVLFMVNRLTRLIFWNSQSPQDLCLQ